MRLHFEQSLVTYEAEAKGFTYKIVVDQTGVTVMRKPNVCGWGTVSFVEQVNEDKEFQRVLTNPRVHTFCTFIEARIFVELVTGE